MQTISYSTKLIFETEADKQLLMETLEAVKFCWNECSKVQFSLSKKSIVDLHREFYKSFRLNYPEIPAQLVIATQRNVLGTYRAIGKKGESPASQKRLKLQCDNYCYKWKQDKFKFITKKRNSRIFAKPLLYGKLQEYLSKYTFVSPFLFVRGKDIYINLFFKIPTPTKTSKLAIGIDLGIRRFVATSEGKLLIDKQYNKEKRKIRYLKRCLASKGTQSAKRHLKKLQCKERNINKNFNYHLVNKVLKTKADTFVIEDLSKIKKSRKQNKYRSQNRISQISFYEFKRILTYKAGLLGKTVVEVNPAYTSQTDCITGKREGIRSGCRFYAKSGLVYDADINASVNLAKLAKLPFLCGNILDGQASVDRLIVNVPRVQAQTI